MSILGFGCMRFPVIDDDYANINEQESTKLLRHAIDNGVNYVDTAWGYHRGASEPFVGKALRDGYREKVYLATKMPSWLIESYDDCEKYLNEQLARLETDHIDFYLVHSLNKAFWGKVLKADGLKFLANALADGRIGHAGFSFHDYVETFKTIVDAWDWSFCQIQYNYMDEEYQAGTEGLMYAHNKGMSVIGMEPLRGGKLTKRIPDEVVELLSKRGQAHFSKQCGLGNSIGKNVPDPFLARTPAELGLRWVWNHPEISVVLSGMNAMEQVEENLRIADEFVPGSMSAQELDVIEKIKQIYKERIKYLCTSCRYCLPCPEGVRIPEILNCYNGLMMYRDEEWSKFNYKFEIKPERRADKCVECGKCEELCPQGIKIREAMKEAHEKLGE